MPAHFGGAARYYRQGRLPYPAGLAEVVERSLQPGGRGRLLDLGCGPGSLTAVLAPLFDEVVGIDADVDMIAEARALGLPGASWWCGPAEQLPPDLGSFRVVSFAQSFHWMDRPRVAAAVWDLLEPEGVCLFVYAWSLSGEATAELPAPPLDALDGLVADYLGAAPVADLRPVQEAEHLVPLGFAGPEEVTVPGGQVVRSGEEDLIARCLSRSSSSPSAFGDRLEAFRHDARQLLRAVSPGGVFEERLRDARVVVWRKPLSAR